jgi:hypothetical protein
VCVLKVLSLRGRGVRSSAELGLVALRGVVGISSSNGRGVRSAEGEATKPEPEVDAWSPGAEIGRGGGRKKVVTKAYSAVALSISTSMRERTRASVGSFYEDHEFASININESLT